jgi:hypothetical protein
LCGLLSDFTQTSKSSIARAQLYKEQKQHKQKQQTKRMQFAAFVFAAVPCGGYNSIIYDSEK